MAVLGDLVDISYTNPVFDGTVTSASFWNPHLTDLKTSINLLNAVVNDEITATNANVTTNATDITTNVRSAGKRTGI